MMGHIPNNPSRILPELNEGTQVRLYVDLAASETATVKIEKAGDEEKS
jgi:hypothetical protein